MNRQIRSTILLVVTLVAGPSFRAFCFFKSSPNLKVEISLPAASLDLSDLDVRDEFNRPIRTSAKVRILERLFVTNLNRLLMNNLTQTKQRLWALLSEKWDVFSGFLRRQFNRFNKRFSAFLSKKKFSDEFKKSASSVTEDVPDGADSFWPPLETDLLNPVVLHLAVTRIQL